jgi:uncharacterized protein (TIGR02266 family)
MMKEKETDVQERRKYVRLTADVEVRYDVLDTKSHEAMQAVTRNISAGGICLIINEQLPIGTVLQLDIYLPQNQPVIKAKGKIVWISAFRMANEKERYDAGIEFIEIDEEQRKIIDKYVLRH